MYKITGAVLFSENCSVRIRLHRCICYRPFHRIRTAYPLHALIYYPYPASPFINDCTYEFPYLRLLSYCDYRRQKRHAFVVCNRRTFRTMQFYLCNSCFALVYLSNFFGVLRHYHRNIKLVLFYLTFLYHLSLFGIVVYILI